MPTATAVLIGMLAAALNVQGQEITITAQPSGQTVNLGENATFSVLATGADPLAYQWQFNQADIPGANVSSCTITNAQSFHMGYYRVIISNYLGSVTSSAAPLKIFGEPQISVDGLPIWGGSITRPNTAQISMQTAFPNGSIFYTLDGSEPSFASTLCGEPFTLTCAASVRAVAYDETFSQAVLSLPVQVLVLPTYILTATTAGGGTITIDPPTGPYLSNTVVTVTAIADPGWSFLYWTGDASGSNSTTSVTMEGPRSVQAVFGTGIRTTVVGQGTVLLSPNQTLYPYGSSVGLSAIPSNGYYFVRWANASTSTVSPLVVTVTQPNPTFTALFSTLPTNQFFLTLLVNGRGTVAASPQKNVFTNGEAVTLTAIPDSGQTLDSWSGDATGSSNQITLLMNQSRIIMANFRPGIPPLITQQPVSVTVTQGQNAAFVVIASGDTPLSYQWQLGGTDIEGATQSLYTLTNAQASHAGPYVVVITNNYGKMTSDVATLTVRIPPFITQQPAGLSVPLGQSATFTVVATGDSPLGYQWFHDNVQLTGVTGPDYTVPSVQWADLGNFHVVVSNPYSSVTSSVATLDLVISEDSEFNVGANGDVYSLALQADGKILVGVTSRR